MLFAYMVGGKFQQHQLPSIVQNIHFPIIIAILDGHPLRLAALNLLYAAGREAACWPIALCLPPFANGVFHMINPEMTKSERYA